MAEQCVKIWVFDSAPAKYKAIVKDVEEFVSFIALVPEELAGEFGYDGESEMGFGLGIGQAYEQENGDLLVTIG